MTELDTSGRRIVQVKVRMTLAEYKQAVADCQQRVANSTIIAKPRAEEIKRGWEYGKDPFDVFSKAFTRAFNEDQAKRSQQQMKQLRVRQQALV